MVIMGTIMLQTPVEKRAVPNAYGYKRGCIFKELSGKKDEEMEIGLSGRNEAQRRAGAWDFNNTPLDKYASATSLLARLRTSHTNIYFNFITYLEKKIVERNRLGNTEPLKILDIGVGEGRQWLNFLSRHRRSVDFSATTLKGDVVVPEIKDYVRECEAIHIPDFFPPNNFDVVVARHSLYEQELAGVEAALWVLKPGGEAIIAGTYAFRLPDNPAVFSVVMEETTRLRAGFFHLRKLAHPMIETEPLVEGLQ